MNKTAAWLLGIGWLFIATGIGLGIYYGLSSYTPESIWKSQYLKDLAGEIVPVTEFNLAGFIPYAFSGVSAGLVLIGLSEIIKLLEGISVRNKD